MIINKNFVSANIAVKRIIDDTVYLENQIRDTTEDWFYWAFKVENAAGRTIKFVFDKVRIGYNGAAVSHDLANWSWSYTRVDDMSFTYTFGEDENLVYFAHNMVYSPEMFNTFCRKKGILVKTLCRDRKGRDVPYVEFGEGDKTILLTSRHHACESSGTFVLEGVIEQFFNNPIKGLHLVAVPFVDFDGVVDGDQGKARGPHDHNRDYSDDFEPLYPTVKAIKEIAENADLEYAFDFHSPWHIGGENDTVFIVRNSKEPKKYNRMTDFAKILEGCITDASLPYKAQNDHEPDVTWNDTSHSTYANFMLNTMGAKLAFTLETAYFKASGVDFCPEKAKELGRCFAEAVRKYSAQ